MLACNWIEKRDLDANILIIVQLLPECFTSGRAFAIFGGHIKKLLFER
jgi:hypothetical protein